MDIVHVKNAQFIDLIAEGFGGVPKKSELLTYHQTGLPNK